MLLHCATPAMGAGPGGQHKFAIFTPNLPSFPPHLHKFLQTSFPSAASRKRKMNGQEPVEKLPLNSQSPEKEEANSRLVEVQQLKCTLDNAKEAEVNVEEVSPCMDMLFPPVVHLQQSGSTSANVSDGGNECKTEENVEERSSSISSSTTVGVGAISHVECVVCGAPASGVHYLAWSCNGCKTFFRRAIMENRKYSCKKEGKCPIDVRSRCSCRHCRFRKCLQVGMKFTEINIDRKRRFHEEDSMDSVDISANEEPLVRELLVKEHRFRALLNSKLAPIYANLEEALAHGQSMCDDNNFDGQEHERNKFNQDEMKLTFHDWRIRILSISIEWIKSFPEFQAMPRKDREALIIHSVFSLLAFSEAFHTPERYNDRLVFPDGLQVTRNFSKGIYIERNGLSRPMVAVVNDILTPIRRIQLTEVEYGFISALLLFDPDCLLLSDQAAEMVKKQREMLVQNFRKHLEEHLEGKSKMESSIRLAQLLLRIPSIQKVAEYKRQFFLQNEEAISGHKSSLAIELAKRYQTTSFF